MKQVGYQLMYSVDVHLRSKAFTFNLFSCKVSSKMFLFRGLKLSGVKIIGYL